jgi:hypothetical protein
MRFKPIIIIIGVLIFVQIMFFNYTLKENIALISQEIAQLDTNIRQMDGEKTRLVKRFDYLKGIIETIPHALLMGFEDPETGFVEFLDYLQTPILDEVEGEISLRETQKFKEVPIPLHESNFGFKFSFIRTYEAEKFFNYLLLQKKYPLQVRSLKIRRGSEGKAEGTLNVSLLIPAKLQLPTLSKESEGK